MRVILKASPNAVQIENWNNASGRTWAQYQEALDRQIEPLGAQAIRVLAPRAGERILDIGCGCGHTTVELAQRVRPGGLVLGVDVSVPMLEVARRRPLPQADFQVAFQQADAQCDALGEAAFDAAYSRFGVMFFSDPVAAFANIRLALKTGGRLSFVCWRPLEQNEWMKVPLEAALPFLPSAQMPPDLGAPGPFAFAERSRISNVLTEAGFDTVSIAAYDTAIGGDFEQAVRLALRVGPLGAALREHPACEAGVTDAVRSSLTRHVRQGVVMMRASVWIVRAESRQARSD